jgi:hypothetical protein
METNNSRTLLSNLRSVLDIQLLHMTEKHTLYR